MASVKGGARLTRALRRALRPTLQPAYWQRELTVGGQLEPAYFTLLLPNLTGSGPSWPHAYLAEAWTQLRMPSGCPNGHH